METEWKAPQAPVLDRSLPGLQIHTLACRVIRRLPLREKWRPTVRTPDLETRDRDRSPGARGGWGFPTTFGTGKMGISATGWERAARTCTGTGRLAGRLPTKTRLDLFIDGIWLEGPRASGSLAWRFCKDQGAGTLQAHTSSPTAQHSTAYSVQSTEQQD